MSENIEIIIGTYEEFLLGYKLDYKDGEVILSQSFADKSHTGSIKCLAVQGKYIATGGTDDRIFIYDMKTRKQSQILLNHEGTVNSIAFTSDDTHILSGGDDGRMVAVRLNTWQVGANWTKAHSGATVTHISCHPSGKLALSLGSDLILRTWNLVKGRVAYKTNLKSKVSLGTAPDCLSWSPTGDCFSLTGQRVVEIWCIKKADVLKSEKTTSKPICVCWAGDNLLLVGSENGSILFISVDDDKTVTVDAHKSRVKDMSICDNILVSASSCGDVKMWTVDTPNRTLTLIATTNIGCRPTCIGILGLEQFGPNYGKQNVLVSMEDTVKLKEETSVPRERGIVTIEYAEDEEKPEASVSDVEDSEEELKPKGGQKRKHDKVEESDNKQAVQTKGEKKAKKKKKKNPLSNVKEPGAFVKVKKGK